MIKAKLIKPAVAGESDFFSRKLYQWVKKNPDALTIFRGTWNSISGIDKENPILYIGCVRNDNSISAVPLRRLCSHVSYVQMMSYSAGHDVDNWEDITEQFWESYLRIGVCAIHGDNAHNWIVNEDEGRRICEYCNKVEHKELIHVPKEVWVPASTEQSNVLHNDDFKQPISV
jgi:hypothetical protein